MKRKSIIDNNRTIEVTKNIDNLKAMISEKLNEVKNTEYKALLSKKNEIINSINSLGNHVLINYLVRF